MVFVCLYPINVKTAKPIQPKFFLGPHMTPGKVYEWSEVVKFSLKKLFLNFIFLKEKMQHEEQPLKYKIEGESEASLEA